MATEIARLGVVIELVDQMSPALDGLVQNAKTVGTQIQDVAKHMQRVWSAVGGAEQMAAAGHLADLSAQTGLAVEALQRLGFAATQNGGSLDQVARAASLMGKNLAGGSDSTKAAIEALGLSFDELRKASPEEAFNQIAGALGGLPDKFQQTQLAQALFGKGAIDLIPTLSSNFRELGQSATVMSSETVKALDDAGDKFDEAQANLQAKMGTLLGSVVAAIGPDTAAIGAMLVSVATSIAPLIPAVAALWPALVSLATTIGSALVPALGLLLSPIGLVVAAIVGLGLIWYKWGDDIKRITAEVYKAVKEWLWDKFEAIVRGITGVLTTITGYWEDFKKGVTGVVKETAANTKEYLVDKFDTVKDGVKGALATVKGYWDAHNDAVGKVLDAVIKAVSGWVKDIGDWLGPKLKAIFEAVKAIVTLLLTYHVEVFTAVITKVREFITAIGDWLGAKLRAIVQAVQTILQPIIGFFTAVKDQAIALAQALYTGVFNWLVTKFQDIVAGIKDKIDKVTGFFKGLYQDVVGGSFVPDLINGIDDWFGRLDEVMVAPAEAAAGAVTTAFNDLNTNVNLQELGTKFATTLDNMRIEGEGWKDKILTIWDDVKTGIGEKVEGITRTFLDSLEQMLTGQLSFKEGMRAIWEAIKDAIIDVLSDIVNRYLTEWFNAIAKLVGGRPGGGGVVITPPVPTPGPGSGSLTGGSSYAALAPQSSGGMVMTASTIKVPVYLDGRQIAEAVYADLPGVLQARGVL